MMRIVFVASFVAVLTACSAEFSIGGSSDFDSGEAALLLNEEFEDSLGLGSLETKCAVPNDMEQGDIVTCTSDTEDGLTINWVAVATGDSSMDIESQNLLNEQAVGQLEAAVVEALASEGLPVVAEDLDCGDGVVVLGSDGEVVCALVDSSTGDVYDTTIAITDMNSLQFDVAVADAPRG